MNDEDSGRMPSAFRPVLDFGRIAVAWWNWRQQCQLSESLTKSDSIERRNWRRKTIKKEVIVFQSRLNAADLIGGPMKWIPIDSPWRALQNCCSVQFDWTECLSANSRKLTAGACAIFRYLHAFREFATERLLGSNQTQITLNRAF